MIPDFKTYIKENIWSNINKRSEGGLERKEDNVDNLNLEDLCNYLNSIYKTIGHAIYYTELGNGTQSIEIPLFEKGRHTFYLIYSTDQNCINFADLTDFTPDLYKNLQKKFNASVEENDYGKNVIIKSEKLTNRFVISIVDFIIENPPVNADMCIERKMNESIWSNINKRSEGNTERREDNINYMDAFSFFEYLKERYSSEPDYFDEETGGQILYYVSEKITCFIDGINDYHPYVGIGAALSNDKQLYNKVKNTYTVEYIDSEDPNDEPYFDIRPKNEDVVNLKFFLEVLDFLIDNINGEKYIWRK